MNQIINKLNQTMNPHEASQVKLWHFLLYTAWAISSGMALGALLIIQIK